MPLKTSGAMAEYRTCTQKTSEPLNVVRQTSQLIPLSSCLLSNENNCNFSLTHVMEC